MPDVALIRYGVIPEVARFPVNGDGPYARGQRVVVESHRGAEIGTVLEIVRSTDPTAGNGDDDEHVGSVSIQRTATSDDESAAREIQEECRREFETWRRRIEGWELQLELIDLEWMLDRGKLVLYVLNDRGADCTKLAIYAAAEGLGPVEVQPVNAEGLVRQEPAGGGCGSGGGGCGSCG